MSAYFGLLSKPWPRKTDRVARFDDGRMSRVTWSARICIARQKSVDRLLSLVRQAITLRSSISTRALLRTFLESSTKLILGYTQARNCSTEFHEPFSDILTRLQSMSLVGLVSFFLAICDVQGRPGVPMPPSKQASRRWKILGAWPPNCKSLASDLGI